MKPKIFLYFWLRLVLKNIKISNWLISVAISIILTSFIFKIESIQLEYRLENALEYELEQLILVDSHPHQKVYDKKEHQIWLMQKINEKGIDVNQNIWISLLNIEKIKFFSINRVNSESYLGSDKTIEFDIKIDSSVYTFNIGYDENVNHLLFILIVLILVFPVVGVLELRRLKIHY